MARIEKPIKNFLLDFGLTDKEITIYLSLLKTGPNTIMNLSRETGIKRSTTHNTVEELIKKGLVSQTNYGERRMVVAEDPKKLEFLMEQKRWEMKKLEDNLPDIVKGIYNAVPKAKENSKVVAKYYEGKDDIRSIYEQTLKENQVYSFVNLDKYYEIFPDPIGLQKKALQNNLDREVWDIVIDSPKAREVTQKGYARYNSKFISSEIYFSGFDFLMFGDKVAMIQLDPNNTTGILIESKAISDGLRALHQSMWQLLK